MPEAGSGAPEMVERSRHSHGLEEFSRALAEQERLEVLDCGDVLQANVSFVTGFGHKLYAQAILSVFQHTFRGSADGAPQPDEERVRAFLNAALDFPAAHVGAVLIWDTLEFLPPPAAKAFVERLAEITKSGACLLALFHTEERAPKVPAYYYRILAPDTLHLSPKGWREPAQRFNNRAIEKMFQRFHSVKFFLGRDNLREVIIRR